MAPHVEVRVRRARALPDHKPVRDNPVDRRVGVVWGLLVLNTLTYTGFLFHIPSVLGKVITQGALPAALVLALMANRRIAIRPNMFLCLVSLLAIEATLTALEPQFVGTIYRTFRLAEFVVVLWLLTPWWGRRDILLVRNHLKWLSIVLGSVLLGLVTFPGHALAAGRLSGVFWDIPPTQVAHYAAVVTGLVIVLWLCGEMAGRTTLFVVVVGGAMLVLTHTRTALIGLLAGLVVAGISLIVGKARVRKGFLAAGVLVTIAILSASSALANWLARGEGTKELTSLTGRTVVWGPLLALPRDRFQEIFGFGLSNSSFDGLPIDSNWLSSYQEKGLFGVMVGVALLFTLFVSASFRPRGVERALGLFLASYCLVASFTEDGFTDATIYLLELTLAASLLVSTGVHRGMTRVAAPVSPSSLEGGGEHTGRQTFQ
jgi:hypothetical protein